MDMPDWVSTFPGAVTLSDTEHRILWMNDKAAATFASQGGRSLVGKSLLACHNERSRGMIEDLLRTGSPNVYTIEKKGVKKLIYQTAWKDEAGETRGLLELSLEIPFDIPNFIRG